MNKNQKEVTLKLSEKDCQQASEVLKNFGIDLNTYVKMALAKLVEEKKIPFKIDFFQNTNPAYTPQEAFLEVQASLQMEGFSLDTDDMKILEDYSKGNISGDEIRSRIIDSL